MERIKLCFAAGMIALSSCASVSSEHVGDGMISISCKRNVNNCYGEAQKMCLNGYTILNGMNDSAPAMTNGNLMVARNYNILIRCK